MMDDVVPYSDRVRGKHVTVINTPLLLNPDLSLHHITQAVKECLSLSTPGPHMIILVLKPDECSREEKVCIEILTVFLCGSVVEHCVSSAKGCGFDSKGTHILMKMYNLNVIVSRFG